MILIMSGAFVVPEIENELGAVPPSLLPIGNRMLIELQAESLRNKFDDSITLILPSCYVLTKFDITLFKKLDPKTPKPHARISKLVVKIIYFIKSRVSNIIKGTEKCSKEAKSSHLSRRKKMVTYLLSVARLSGTKFTTQPSKNMVCALTRPTISNETLPQEFLILRASKNHLAGNIEREERNAIMRRCPPLSDQDWQLWW